MSEKCKICEKEITQNETTSYLDPVEKLKLVHQTCWLNAQVIVKEFVKSPLKAKLTVGGVGDKEVEISLPSPYCQADGVIDGLTPSDIAEGFQAILNFPDGVGFLHAIKHSAGGFIVNIK